MVYFACLSSREVVGTNWRSNLATMVAGDLCRPFRPGVFAGGCGDKLAEQFGDYVAPARWAWEAVGWERGRLGDSCGAERWISFVCDEAPES